MTNLESSFKQQIQINMGKIRDEMTLEFAEFDNKLKALDNKLKQPDNSVQITTQENFAQHKLIFKNVNYTDDGDSTESLKAYVDGLLSNLDLNFTSLNVQRIGNHNNGTDQQRPKPLIVTFHNAKDRIDVLKKKRLLNTKDDYKNIYIETDRTRQERMQEANIRRIVKKIPELEFKGGRVVHQSHSQDAKLSVAFWNCNGWYVTKETDDSRTLRENILTSLNFDIVGISESHLRDEQTIDLNGYKWIGNNRKTISTNAWRGSGGVGFLIKNNVFNNFDVNIFDRNRDDILWIYLQCKYDQDVKFYFCVCYLQPERSCRGNIAQEFYDSLLSQIYLYSTGVPIFLCGDFNGRSGLQQDFDDTLDMVLPRQPIDETKNAFGDYLLDFLRDAKCCMLNGRGQKNKDNFTYVSPQGMSVVDYMIVPYGELTKVSNFEVQLVSDLVIDYNIQLSSNVRLPDHSILTCVIHFSEYEEINKLSETIHHSSNTISGNTFNRKYNISTIPRDIFNSERCVRSLQSIIDSMLHRNNIENRINTIYERLVKTLHDEMDEYMEYTDFNESTNKRKRNIGKPYWNAELQQLLLETNKTEKEFLKFKGDRRIRKQLENNYKLKRREFDKRLRQEKRKYTAERLNRIKTMNTSNPKEFWREINKLGPGKENTKIDCVVLNEGGYSNDPNIILGRWKEEYAKLFFGEFK
ncbi:Hypothetical predicted protein [Mytilus galloprovincialis]|uniref:Endonuclease/exonuclease/phosphatase domain-containing protein n=1 Tax=Mytilus galloprovincialis TaxID=29158 RepID=A0A8B6DQ17_MYTGA|nr:Hypothetical predicted protein [Mytilus galloprovincialis]